MKQTKAVRHISRVMAAVMAFSACQQGIALSAFADGTMTLTPKFHENATVEVSGSKITVTDTNYNDDVWNSKALVDTGMTLVPGKQYKIDFNLSGKESVGEFFLCKTESMDARYDDTFTTDPGSRVNTFTAIGEKLFVGMQVGDAGMDNSVTCDIASISELELGDTPTLLKSACADVTMDGKTVTATDTADNNDVWNSKVLFDAGVELIPGKLYDMDLELTGANGVGEFFVCKSLDLNDRVDATFRNTPGTKHMTFVAPGERLYIGMQFGSIGKGNSVSCNVTHVALHEMQPPHTLSKISEADGHIIITATDNNKCGDVWDSKVLRKVADDLIPGKEYEITIHVSGTNGVGEVFLNKNASLDWDKHYDRSDAQGEDGQKYAIFVDNNTFAKAYDGTTDGVMTMRFIAEDTSAYLGMQLGNVGLGNTVTVDVAKPALYNPTEGQHGNTGIKSTSGGVTKVTKKLAPSHTDYDPADHVTENKDTTVLTMTDTSENNDLCDSKMTYFFGKILEAGKKYVAKINIAATKDDVEVADGTQVGEFYFLKSDNLDDRYSFDDYTGDHTVTFEAVGEALYAGAQFGNLGAGNTMTVTIEDLFEAPGTATNTNWGCTTEENRGSVTITDTDGGNDPWNSVAVYDTGITLVEGQEYTASFNMTTNDGTEGMGEFYFLKADNIDDRYTQDTTGGEHTVTFTADSDGTLYMGMMGGNLGEGNSMTVSDIVVTPVSSSDPN